MQRGSRRQMAAKQRSAAGRVARMAPTATFRGSGVLAGMLLLMHCVLLVDGLSSFYLRACCWFGMWSCQCSGHQRSLLGVGCWTIGHGYAGLCPGDAGNVGYSASDSIYEPGKRLRWYSWQRRR